jgi:hypothetical protein
MMQSKSIFVLFIKQTLFDFSIIAFRWYFGFLLSSSFVNLNVLIDWIFEISLIDYLLTNILNYFIVIFFPEEIKVSFFASQVFPRMFSIWLVSLFLNQSLLLLLFSQTLYWLFTIYSKLFLTLAVESVSFVYYFSSFWLLLPLMINLSLSFLYFLDLFCLTNFLYQFSNMAFIKHMLAEWGFHVQVEHNQTANVKTENIFHNNIDKLDGLLEEDNFQYLVIKDRYLINKTDKFLQENLDDLRNFIAQEYYKNQAFFVSNTKYVHLLPLEWAEFSKYRLRVLPSEQVLMFKEYFNNDSHGAWRLLSKSNPWLFKDRENTELKDAFFEQRNIEFIVTIWLAIKSLSHDPNKQDIFKEKLDTFIKILSRFNRLKNSVLSSETFENNTDDKEGDKLGHLQILYSNLLSLVSEKQSHVVLSQNLIQHLLDSFAKSIWLIKLSSLDIERIQEIKSVWLDIMNKQIDYEDHHAIFLEFNFSQSNKDNFILKMNTLFGQKWREKNDFLILIDSYFMPDDIQNKLHPVLNATVFLEALSDVEAYLLSRSKLNIKP